MRRADRIATFLCRLCRNNGKLNLQEPRGHVRACIRIGLAVLVILQLPLLIIIIIIIIIIMALLLLLLRQVISDIYCSFSSSSLSLLVTGHYKGVY